MTLDEFWHGDIRLLEVCQKSYIRHTSYMAWLIGARIFEANSKVSANANRTKKTDKVEQYDDWKDPLKKEKKAITKDELEVQFRKEQANQTAWLHNMLKKK